MFWPLRKTQIEPRRVLTSWVFTGLAFSDVLSKRAMWRVCGCGRFSGRPRSTPNVAAMPAGPSRPADRPSVPQPTRRHAQQTIPRVSKDCWVLCERWSTNARWR